MEQSDGGHYSIKVPSSSMPQAYLKFRKGNSHNRKWRQIQCLPLLIIFSVWFFTKQCLCMPLNWKDSGTRHAHLHINVQGHTCFCMVISGSVCCINIPACSCLLLHHSTNSTNYICSPLSCLGHYNVKQIQKTDTWNRKPLRTLRLFISTLWFFKGQKYR